VSTLCVREGGVVLGLHLGCWNNSNADARCILGGLVEWFASRKNKATKMPDWCVSDVHSVEPVERKK
jgi:hypothetical protein